MTQVIIILVPGPRTQDRIAVAPGTGADLWSELPEDFPRALGVTVPPETLVSEPVWLEADATTRLAWAPGEARLALVGLLSLSPWSALMLWDLAHSCPVGGEILLIDLAPTLEDTPFDRAYYAGWLQAGPRRGRTRRFTKQATAPVEGDAGLGRWSFCVPMGRPDPAVIAALVDRVAGLRLDETEILIACPEEHAPLLPDGVRHVSAPADLTLSAKKNALAHAALLPNLCLFHDRLKPPRNFRQAVEAFGDHYPFCGFQNIAIDPASQAVSRYSDYHMEIGPAADQIAALAPDGAVSPRLYQDLLDVRQNGRNAFLEASVFDYSDNVYLTGSLYMAKRSLWALCGLNEAIDWASLEDVEFGHRALRQFGAPMRVNPFGFARTERVRPLMVVGSHYHRADSPAPPALRPSPSRGPAVQAESESVFALTETDYRERLIGFSRRWVPAANRVEAARQVARADLSDMTDMARLLVSLLYLCQVRQSEQELRAFVRDFTGEVLLAEMDRANETVLVGQARRGRSLADELIRSSYMLHLLLTGETRPLFRGQSASLAGRLRAGLAQAWSDPRSGLGYPGSFDEFVRAIEATVQ